MKSIQRTRRPVIAALAGAALLGAFAPLPAAAQDKTLTVMMWGATWERIFKPLAADFKKETGITLEVVNQTTATEGLAKLQATRSKPQVDVWFTNESTALRAGTDKQLFVPLDPAKIPNIKSLMKGAGSEMFAGVYYGAVGIVYRPDLVPGGKITSWNDLWRPEFKNKVSLPVPTIFPGKMIIIASLLNGGTQTNPDPGIEFLGKVKSNVIFHNADAQARRALAQGELWAMVTTPSAVGALREQKIPVAMASPKPTPLFFEGMMMVRSGKEDMAATFINKVLSPEWQRYITETYNMGPTRQDVPPSASFQEVVPKPGDAVIVDEEFMNLNLGKWTEKFNAMAGK